MDRYMLRCACGERVIITGSSPGGVSCPHCARTIEWWQKLTLPNIFCDTRIAQTLRKLIECGETVKHSVFMKWYADAGDYPQRDSSHWRKYHHWLIKRFESPMMVTYVGPTPREWLLELTPQKREEAFSWAERTMNEFWLKVDRETPK